MAKNFTGASVSSYVDNEWTDLYTYSQNSGKSILLSLLATNTTTGDLTIEYRLVDGASNLKYPITKKTLSSLDEFTLNRMKQLLVLLPGWKVQFKFSGAGIYTYYSALENVQ